VLITLVYKAINGLAPSYLQDLRYVSLSQLSTPAPLFAVQPVETLLSLAQEPPKIRLSALCRLRVRTCLNVQLSGGRDVISAAETAVHCRRRACEL